MNNFKIKLIVCSSMNNYDVKENLANSFFISEPITANINDYFYVGCILRLNPFKEPLKDESLEFKRNLSQFGNLPYFDYKLKEAERYNIEYERFLKNEQNEIKKEILRFFDKNNDTMEIKLTKIIYYVKEKHIFLFNELRVIY